MTERGVVRVEMSKADKSELIELLDRFKYEIEQTIAIAGDINRIARRSMAYDLSDLLQKYTIPWLRGFLNSNDHAGSLARIRYVASLMDADESVKSKILGGLAEQLRALRAGE